jgi:hypothetical protein
MIWDSPLVHNCLLQQKKAMMSDLFKILILTAFLLPELFSLQYFDLMTVR